MANTYNYTTKGRQRWCDVSNNVYGTSNQIGVIAAANPGVPLTAVITEGTVLQIPILATVDTPISNELLPPWKQN